MGNLINTNGDVVFNELFNELSQLITKSQRGLVNYANSTLTILFWEVGRRIKEEILQHKRADYGKQIVSVLASKLESTFGKNFTEKNLRRMIQFAEQFADYEIVVPLARQLSWSHILILLPIKNEEAKRYYAQKAAQELWGKRELRQQINRKAFERSEIASIQTINTELFDSFKDPYLLDFLGLDSSFLERDLETAILRELESFILELGKGFAFLERQKRIIIDGEDFHLDLLFYHRKLKRLVAIELKLGKFEAAHKGQMELYLRWLDKYEKQPDENSPIGLILCAESSREQIELLEMHKDGIVVAEYWTELPPKIELEQKIHSLLVEVRERIEQKKYLDFIDSGN